ncbi:MAG: hypothetical protein HWE14_07035 [Flavobacteriia bacterium]|nr:hypothetical protein [Flavobacteriia bacterium]
MKSLLLFILLSLQVVGQEKTYVLQEKTEHGDINHELFDQFGNVSIYQNNGLERAFEPIEGEFEVYVFEAQHIGLSFDGSTKLFHDKLILKVDPESGFILDGYQYTMEWAEPMPSADLYHVEAIGVYIARNMTIEELQLKPVDEYGSGETHTGTLHYRNHHLTTHKKDILFEYSWSEWASDSLKIEVMCKLINTSSDTVYFLSTTCYGLPYSILYSESLLEIYPMVACNATYPHIQKIAPHDTLEFEANFKRKIRPHRVDLFYDFYEVEADFSVGHMSFSQVHHRRSKSIIVGVQKP